MIRQATIAQYGAVSPDARLRRPTVSRLMLSDYRNYPALDLAIHADLVVLTGENGAGKTNVLEALSLLSPGRGLRRAELGHCLRTGAKQFSIAATVCDGDFTAQLGTGFEAEGAAGTRKFRLDRVPVSSPRVFCDHLRIIWITPAMDGLFAGAAGERRRFLDRLVLTVDPAHGARVNALERSLRNRNRLLERGSDRLWLNAAEREVAEIAIAVTAARLETVSRLAAVIAAGRDDASPFPWADLALAGILEQLVAGHSALEAEDRYRALLADNRARDTVAGRTLLGPQASDLVVRHGPKQMLAQLCSTGEQKALLVGLVLAHARLVSALSEMAPLILLDEIAAHFDPRRRTALFDALAGLGGQAWLTGADPAAFSELSQRAQMLVVTSGTIEQG